MPGLSLAMQSDTQWHCQTRTKVSRIQDRSAVLAALRTMPGTKAPTSTQPVLIRIRSRRRIEVSLVSCQAVTQCRGQYRPDSQADARRHLTRYFTMQIPVFKGA